MNINELADEMIMNEERQCNNCGEVWACTGDDVCRFCESDDTQPVEDSDRCDCDYAAYDFEGFTCLNCLEKQR